MTKVSKYKKRAYIMLFVIIALLLMFFFVDNFAHENVQKAYEIKAVNADNEFISFNQTDELNITAACVYKEIDANIETDSQHVSGIKAVLTNQNYYELYKLSMVAGTFFSEDDVEKKQQYVIISDNLALKLYLRKNPIGETIYIDNYSYTILGVYEENDTFWGSINKDNYDRIYIPYSSYPEYSSIPIDAIAFTNDDMLFENIDAMLAQYPQYMGNLSHYNYIEKLAFSTQPVPILLFSLQLILIFFILRMVYSPLKLTFKKVYAKKETEYLKDIIKTNSKNLIYLSVFILVGIIGVVFLAKSIKFPILIPVSAIPNDNLFHINHYTSKIVQAMQKENSIDMLGNNYSYLLLNRTFFVELVLLSHIYPTMIVLYKNIKKLYALDFVSFVEILGYSTLISVILIVLLFFVLDTISVLAVYIIIILLSFLLILVIKYYVSEYIFRKSSGL